MTLTPLLPNNRAPYTNTCDKGDDTFPSASRTGSSAKPVTVGGYGPAQSFSKGIWKNVYLVGIPKAGAAISHLVPQITYAGAYPTAPLGDGDGAHAGFDVSARVFLRTRGPAKGTLTVAGSWLVEKLCGVL